MCLGGKSGESDSTGAGGVYLFNAIAHSRIEGLDLPWFQRIEIHTDQYYAQWAKQSDMSYETLTPQLYCTTDKTELDYVRRDGK